MAVQQASGQCTPVAWADGSFRGLAQGKGFQPVLVIHRTLMWDNASALRLWFGLHLDALPAPDSCYCFHHPLSANILASSTAACEQHIPAYVCVKARWTPVTNLIVPLCCCREETHCRFCNSKYQLDWRTSLAAGSSETDSNSSIASRAAPSAAPAAAAAAAPQLRRAPTPVMAIIFEGQVHRIKVSNCSPAFSSSLVLHWAN